MTRVDLPVTYNFRPVQGVRPGALYRSDALAKANRHGRRRLQDLGVTRVIDLRSEMDRRLGGADRLRGVGADLVKVPMLGGGKLSDLNALTLESIYRDLLDGHGDQLARVIAAVADAPEGAVVVHCTAGKDRSGVTSALIQLAVGVPEGAVVDDYARTHGNLSGEWEQRMLRKMRRMRIELTPNLREVFVGSPADAMAATLAHLEQAHGGADAYLAAIGNE